jgi:hypothetical protein
MAFNAANLVYVAQATPNSAAIWRYSTSDALSVVEESSPLYFGAAEGYLRTGDILGVSANDGKRIYTTSGVGPALQFCADVDAFAWD